MIKIVAVGDSTTAGTPAFLSPLESPPNGAGDRESQYAYWLMLRHTDWNVLNRGINGERSDQILARFKRNVVEEEPEIAVILAGVNDIYQGLPSDYPARNLSKMYSMASGAGIVPVSCTVLPYNTMGPKEAEVRRKLNAWIEAESSRLGIPFSDTAEAASDPSNKDRLAGSPDGLHPDVEGYRKMAGAIAGTIEALLSGGHVGHE
jgi:lysophospholipase L1-like esterase